MRVVTLGIRASFVALMLLLAGCQTPQQAILAEAKSASKNDDRSVGFLIGDVTINGEPCTRGPIRFLSDRGRNVTSAFAKKFDSINNRYSRGELVELIPAKLEPDTYSFVGSDCLKTTAAGFAKQFVVSPGAVISLGVINISRDAIPAAGTVRSATVTSRPFTAQELAGFRQKYPGVASRMVHRSWESLSAARPF